MKMGVYEIQQTLLTNWKTWTIIRAKVESGELTCVVGTTFLLYRKSSRISTNILKRVGFLSLVEWSSINRIPGELSDKTDQTDEVMKGERKWLKNSMPAAMGQRTMTACPQQQRMWTVRSSAVPDRAWKMPLPENRERRRWFSWEIKSIRRRFQDRLDVALWLPHSRNL